VSEKETFEHSDGYCQGEVSGNLQLERIEANYRELFAEAIEDGVITPEERSKLSAAAEQLGLERSQLTALEHASREGYQAQHGRKVLDLDGMFESGDTLTSEGDDEVVPEGEAELSAGSFEKKAADEVDDEKAQLRQRVEQLEARVKELESELQQAQSAVAIEVDLSYLQTPNTLRTGSGDPAVLQRRIWHDPRDPETLRELCQAHDSSGNVDGQWRAAQALVFLEAANEQEKELYELHRQQGLIKPANSLTKADWRRLLFHPEDDVLTGEIFSAIVSAVLVGHMERLRVTNALPQLAADQRQDPEKSTVQAVRCFTWAASILGMNPPPVYTDPDYPGLVDIVPAIPPAARLGAKTLSDRSPQELAFLAGRHLAYFREERFVRLLVPQIEALHDLFLAALNIGHPGLPLETEVKRRITTIANALEPLLTPAQADFLRSRFSHFADGGGRTNLLRWTNATDRTALRTGFLLSGDLKAAAGMLELSEDPQITHHMDDLIVFCTSDRYGKLRETLGIALAADG